MKLCNATPSNISIQYTADLDNVREVTLHGAADLSFWEAELHKENLVPYHAILAGETESYPFSPATDRFELTPSARHRIFSTTH